MTEVGSIQLTTQQEREMHTAALAMLGRSYAPYSHFVVGSAILGESGRIYTGCNVENSSYGLSI